MSRLYWSLLLIAVTAIWGWTFTVMQQPTKQYGAIPFLTVRFAIASVLMFPALMRPSGRSALRDGWWIGIVLAGAYLLQTLGLVRTTATNCGLITGLFVIFTPLMNRIIFRVPIPKVIFLAALLSVVGLLLLTGTGIDPLNSGDLLTLFAAMLFGLHIACLDRVARHHNVAALAVTQFITVTILLGMVWPFVSNIEWPTGNVWQALLITGILATAVGFYVQTAVQQHLSAMRVALILTMEPLFAALFGMWLGGDRLNALQWTGAGVMLLAVLVAEVMPRMAGEQTKKDLKD